MPTTTATTQATSDNVAYQLEKAERLLGRMAHLLDAADHPGVHLTAHYKPCMHIVWSTYDQWVSACDWLSDIGADFTTREIGTNDNLMVADGTVDNVDVTFSSMKRQA